MHKRRLFGSAKIRRKSAADLKSEYYIVGLGNPGGRYEKTRHNAGFDVVTILSQRHDIAVRMHQFTARLGKGCICGKKVVLAMPQTYMNRSGESVKAMAAALGIGSKQLILVYDDMDLPPGTVRIKEKGSAGTHNGMRSVIYQLQTDEIVRVRVGIGKATKDTVDFVLEKHDDTQTAFDSLGQAADAVETIIKHGINEAQNRFN